MTFAGDMVTDGTDDVMWGQLFQAGDWLYGTIPTLPTPGNHEYHDGESESKALTPHWNAQFALPDNGPEGLKGSAYYTDYQGARIISLNSSEKIDEQGKWLEKVLADNPNRWTIIVFHHPFFSLAKGRDNIKVRETWKPIVDKYKVDLVLNGHDHVYGRSPVVGSTVYVTSMSGTKMYTMDPATWPARKAENSQLFQIIRIDGDKLSFESRTATGTLLDSFELQKQPAGANKLTDTLHS
jgi:hypothetical protein